MRIYDNKDEKIAIKDDFMDKFYQNLSGTRPKNALGQSILVKNT